MGGRWRPECRSERSAAGGWPSVAVVGPFSGPRADWGRLLQDGARRLRAAGVACHLLDDRGDAGVAARLAPEVAAAGHLAVVGHLNSLGAAAALPLYAAAELPVILPLATRPGLAAVGGGWAVQVCPDDAGQAEAIAAELREQGDHLAEVVHDGTEYGRGLATLVAARLGTEVREPAWPGFSGAAGLAARRGTLVLCGQHHRLATLAGELRERGCHHPFLFTDDCSIPAFGELAGRAADGARVVRLAGGAERYVEAACGALATAVAGRPWPGGPALVAAVRREVGSRLGAADEEGRRVGPRGWEVLPVQGRRAPRMAARSSGRRPPAVDVAVVGAGAVGAAVAATLARQGAGVVSLDAGSERSATAFSGGLVRAYEADPGRRALAIRSHQLTWGQEEAARRVHGFRQTGSLVLLGAGDLPEARRGVEQMRSSGIAAEILRAGEVAERWPWLSVAGVVAAVWEPGGGHADPPTSARTLLDHAHRDGAELRSGCAVREIRHGAGGSVELVTSRGPLCARVAVLAAGCGTPALLGVRTPPGLRLRSKRIRYAFFDGAPPHPPAVVDLVTGMWGRRTADGRLLAGHPVDEWDAPAEGGCDMTPGQGDAIRRNVVARWPGVETAPCRGGRYGSDLYAAGPPLLGPLDGAPQVIVAAGWSGAGYKTSPASAELAAAAALACLGRPTAARRW